MSLRKHAEDEQHPPYVWMPLRRLRIDPEHQGRLYPSTIKRLESTWKGRLEGNRVIGLPGCLQVTPENGAGLQRGVFDIADGLHRYTIARQLYGEDALVLCQVTWHASPAAKSALYLDVNSQHSRHPFDRYRNAVQAGIEDPDYARFTEVDRSIIALGLQVAENGAPLTTLRCPNALMQVHTRGGVALLANSLTLIRTTWATDDDRFNGFIVEGVGLLIAKHPELDRAAFAKKLGKHAAANLIGEARALHKAKFRDSPFGTSVAALVAHKLRDHYNGGRNANRLGAELATV